MSEQTKNIQTSGEQEKNKDIQISLVLGNHYYNLDGKGWYTSKEGKINLDTIWNPEIITKVQETDPSLISIDGFPVDYSNKKDNLESLVTSWSRTLPASVDQITNENHLYLVIGEVLTDHATAISPDLQPKIAEQEIKNASTETYTLSASDTITLAIDMLAIYGFAEGVKLALSNPKEKKIKDMSRRAFLRLGAIGTAGALASPYLMSWLVNSTNKSNSIAKQNIPESFFEIIDRTRISPNKVSIWVNGRTSLLAAKNTSAGSILSEKKATLIFGNAHAGIAEDLNSKEGRAPHIEKYCSMMSDLIIEVGKSLNKNSKEIDTALKSYFTTFPEYNIIKFDRSGNQTFKDVHDYYQKCAHYMGIFKSDEVTEIANRFIPLI